MVLSNKLPEGKSHRVVVEYQDKTGSKVKLEADLPLVMSAGSYQTPVIDSPENLDTKWISDWLEETGLGTMITKDPGTLLEKCKSVWLASQYLVPRLRITDERLKAFSLYIVLVAIMADLPELKKMKEGGGSQKIVAVLGKVVGDILAGKYQTVDELPEVPDNMVPIVKALYVVSQISSRDIPCYKEECQWLVTSMNKTIGAASLIECDFLDESPDTFKFLKRFAGPESLIELSAMANTVTLPESMRTHLLFQQIMSKASSITSATMDIKLLKINLDTGNRMSTINFWKRQGYSVEEAFEKTSKELKEDAFDFRLLCFHLRAMNKKNSRLDRFLKNVEEFIDGNTIRSVEKELAQFEQNK